MILTIAHTKGGVGKSTLVWHLAHSFQNKLVAVIDLDFQQTLHYLNLIGDSKLTLIQPQNSEELIDFITFTAPCYDFVLIDVGGFDSDINRTALRYSDKIIIPVSDSVTEVLGWMTFREILKEISTSADFYMILNNIHPLTKNFNTIKEAIADTNVKLLDTIVRSRKIYKLSMGNGTSVFDVEDAIQSQREIRGVRDELISSY